MNYIISKQYVENITKVEERSTDICHILKLFTPNWQMNINVQFY